MFRTNSKKSWAHRKSLFTRFNLLSPKIHIQILQTDLHTFPPRISWENLVKDQSILSFLTIFLVLITFSLTCEVIIVGRKIKLITLGTERVKIQTFLLINLLVLHTGTTTGSAKGSKFFPDLSAARQKAERRWVTMYFLTEWEGRTEKYLAWGVQSLNQKTLLKCCLWQITSSPILWCPQLSADFRFKKKVKGLLIVGSALGGSN